MIPVLPRSAAAALTLLFALGAAAQVEMRLDVERQSLTGTHRHFTQYIDGVPVVGAERSESLLREGLLRVNYESRAARKPAAATVLSAPGRDAGAEFVYVNVEGEARPAWLRIETKRPLEPHAHYYDAQSGALLRDVPLYFSATGRVFDINPVAKLNDPSLRDQNVSPTAVPDAAYSIVELPGLASSGILSGPNAQIVDVEPPFTPHADASQPLMFNRGQPQFAEVNAYYQIDRAQRYIQGLGYTGAKAIAAYSLPIDPHAANGTDNSYYLEGSQVGRGTLYFGDGGTPDAEDSDIMLHEFMHAVHDWIIPGALNGTVQSQARAVSEGLGDYWSFSSTYYATTLSGRDPFCIGDWDARCGGDDPSRQCGYPIGADCLRRVDSPKTIADYVNSDAPGTEHKNGEMWSSALREIFMTLAERYGLPDGKRVTDTIVLESLYGLPPNPTFETVAQSMVAADRLLRAGAEIDVICGAMTSRGLLTNCVNVPRGEWTLIPGGDQPLPIPDGTGSATSKIVISDARAINNIAVRVDITHPSRGDLAITLTAPDGTTFRLKESSAVDRSADVHATFGFDAPTVDSLAPLIGQPANGTWTLTVSDVYADGAGSLTGWSLRIAFAGDTALSQRPSMAQGRIIVPVVGHGNGGSGPFTSDLFLLNRSGRDTHPILVFTPSGADGTTNFAAMRLTIAAAQTVALRDVVMSVFGLAGTGTISIDAAGSDLLATSSATTMFRGVPLTQIIDTVSESDPATSGEITGPGDPPLQLFPIFDFRWRRNIGLAETSGARGTVKIVVRNLSGGVTSTINQAIEPWSHVQIPLSSGTDITQFATVSATGGAHVVAYVSLIDSIGNAMTILGRQVVSTATTMIVPVVASTAGIGGKWRSEVWYDNLTQAEDGISDVPALQKAFYYGATGAKFTAVVSRTSDYTNDILGHDFLFQLDAYGYYELLVPPKSFVMTRLYAPFAASLSLTAGERVQPVNIARASGAGSSVDAMPVRRSLSYRTNFGITEVSGAPVDVRVSLIAPDGSVLAQSVVTVGAHCLVQLPLQTLFPGDVGDGRLHFEVIGGGGRIFAYASVVHAANNPFFVLAR